MVKSVCGALTALARTPWDLSLDITAWRKASEEACKLHGALGVGAFHETAEVTVHLKMCASERHMGENTDKSQKNKSSML